MKTFLEELANKVYKDFPVLDEVTLVFPNRRASLYFRKHLGMLLSKPAFSPTLITIEEFISGFSPLKVPDKLQLIYELHAVYQKIVNHNSDEPTAEGIDSFYFWGDMLLRDFDEIDKYLVDASQLFKDLSHQKELDSSFDFLTDEQRDFLKSFWSTFDQNETANKKKFLFVWRRLWEVYSMFKTALEKKGLAFEGMLHRNVAEKLETLTFAEPRKLIFAGFNALTAAEEKILSHFVERGATIEWDLDAYYVNNVAQEAGKFFREYQEHPVLKKTFAPDIPSHFDRKIIDKKPIRLYGAPQPIGQVKLMAQMLDEAIANGIKPEETLIVLPDEKLLLPVLHSISTGIEKLNVTMGFPLASTPVFNFVELVVDLQINRKGDHFNHRQVLALLGHPYVIAADAGSAQSKRKEILKNNWVHIPKSYLATEVRLHRTVFQELDLGSQDRPLSSLTKYLKDIIIDIGSLPTLSALDKEYAFHFVKFFNRLDEVFSQEQQSKREAQKNETVLHLKSFLRLFRQLIRANKIPFAGEPLRGLQIMGVLETRNLDYKNVFILSLNEGSFPALSGKGSYVPFSIRKAYKLPTVEHQDAIYSYLFYRVLQRAENISLFYNSETDVLGQGEMSRYLQQILFESGIPIEKKVLHNSIQPQGINPIILRKNEEVLKQLIKLNEGNAYFKGISPSALNTYIECRLKFYFRHVAKVREADEVEEELDARVLGNFLHDVMENFYKKLTDQKGSSLIELNDFDGYAHVIDDLIDKVFIASYRLDPSKEVKYEGQRLVVREIVKRFAHRIIEIDKGHAPFNIEGLEQEGLTFSVKLDVPPYKAIVGGKIDRVDRKGDQIRVIDYKTGKDKLNFESVASLFTRDTKRNKAAFQTLLYALLYRNNFLKNQHGIQLVPGLINRLNLFEEDFSFGLRVGRDQITDVNAILPEFEGHLKTLFEDLFNPEQHFDQTADLENCKLCPYTAICYR